MAAIRVLNAAQRNQLYELLSDDDGGHTVIVSPEMAARFQLHDGDKFDEFDPIENNSLHVLLALEATDTFFDCVRARRGEDPDSEKA